MPDLVPSIQHLNRSMRHWSIEKPLYLWRRRSERRLSVIVIKPSVQMFAGMI
jgi:hypothetical protein